MEESEIALELDVNKIMQYIQIRYPVLMVDYAKVIPGKHATGYKLLTYNERFWQGHYPTYPIFPGSYQLEALSQLFSLTFLTQKDGNAIPKLVGFDAVRFFKEVVPGDRFDMEAELLSHRHGLAKGIAKAYVNDVCVCSAEMKIMFDIEKSK